MLPERTRTAIQPEIRRLAEARFAVPVLRDWFVEEWMPWYGPDGPGDATADLLASCNTERLPLAVVAVASGDRVLGTAALKNDSLGSELGIGPWLAAVLVGPEHRGRGVGTALIAAIEDEARRLDLTAIYTATDNLMPLLEHRRWKPVGEEIQSLRGPVTVLRLAL